MPENFMSKKKPFFPIENDLKQYLKTYNRQKSISITYDDLLNSFEQLPIYNKHGEDTLWRSMIYQSYEADHIFDSLKDIYSLLVHGGDNTFTDHLTIAEVAFCLFGNSKPFRIKIVNQYNDNHDYFYIKTADSSRVFGLELEDILSPNRLNYIVDDYSKTLVEEHIIGIPGDIFMKDYVDRPSTNKVRLAKEFIKFNERCFIRLLGDMRSYNYVIDVTPDFDEEQYRVRAIDFDQQTYEGRKNIYLPQFFKENNPVIKFVTENINPQTIQQYREEERVLMARRYREAKDKVLELASCMRTADVGMEKLQQLKKELNKHHKTTEFDLCNHAGDVLRTQLRLMLE